MTYITFQHKSDMSSDAVAAAQKISQDTWTETDAWDQVDQMGEKQIREEIYEKGTFTEIEEENRIAARGAGRNPCWDAAWISASAADRAAISDAARAVTRDSLYRAAWETEE